MLFALLKQGSQEEWMISHCSADPLDYMYRDSNRKNGFYLGRLHWPEGEYPRLLTPGWNEPND